jgi:hypothetical protein
MLDAAAALPDEQLTPAVYADARSNAKLLCRQAVDAYKKVNCPGMLLKGPDLATVQGRTWLHSQLSCGRSKC